MTVPNPYRSSATLSAPSIERPRSKSRWAAVGFVIGCLPPVAFGIYGLHSQSVYAASLPPGEYMCGMGSLAAMMFIFPIGPVLGLVGAGAGWVAAAIDWGSVRH